jgi:hypothetical protein
MGHSETHARVHQHFNDRDFASIEALAAPGFMYEDLARGLTVKTPAEFTDYLKGWVAALSDATPGSATYQDGPDFSIARFHGRGHFDGALGGYTATGRMMDVPFCEVLHYASDGKILNGELYYDQMTMLGQLGLMPTDAGSTPAEAPSGVVRAMMRDFDRMDFPAVQARFTDDVCGIDEISRAWVRDRAGMLAYFSGLEGQVTDIASTLVGLDEKIWGDTAIVTGWIEQDYRMQGEATHVSSPMTIALRRSGESWKVALVHVIPLPDEAG